MNSDSIQDSEKEFIDTLNAELDWDAIEKLLLEKHGFSVQEDVNYKDGNLIVHNNAIAYKFDFEIKVPLSVIFNREGECLKISTDKTDGSDLEADDMSVLEDLESETAAKGKESSDSPVSRDEDMVSEIVDMISEINKEG